MKMANRDEETPGRPACTCWKSFRCAVRWGFVSAATSGLAYMLLIGPADRVIPPEADVTYLDALPNHDFTSDIMSLRGAGSLQEGLDLARFVKANPDLPGQAEAALLEKEIEHELQSVVGHGKRVVYGFVTGEGSSIDELGGAIASDMVLYGDLRDLCKQGYRRVRGKETDSLIASLAAIGLLTECIDIADWGPAVLKALRKANSLTMRFASWTIGACRRSVKARRLEPALRKAMANLGDTVKKLGFGRTATITRHVSCADDLAVVAKAARRSPDTAYLMVKLGGRDGIEFLRAADRTADGLDTLRLAVKKGPTGLDWLRRNGCVRRVVITTRVGARTVKNFRLGRPQRLFSRVVDAASGRYPWVKRSIVWGGPAVAGIALLSVSMTLSHLICILLVLSGRLFRRRRATSGSANGKPSGSILVAK